MPEFAHGLRQRVGFSPRPFVVVNERAFDKARGGRGGTHEAGRGGQGRVLGLLSELAHGLHQGVGFSPRSFVVVDEFTFSPRPFVVVNKRAFLAERAAGLLRGLAWFDDAGADGGRGAGAADEDVWRRCLSRCCQAAVFAVLPFALFQPLRQLRGAEGDAVGKAHLFDGVAACGQLAAQGEGLAFKAEDEVLALAGELPVGCGGDVLQAHGVDVLGCGGAAVFFDGVAALGAAPDVGVAACAANEMVVALVAGKEVVACAAPEAVVAQAAVDFVVAFSPVEPVVAAFAVEVVVSGFAAEGVLALAAVEPVAALAAEDAVVAAFAVEVVFIRAAMKLVVAFRSVEPVCALAAAGDVVARAAV